MPVLSARWPLAWMLGVALVPVLADDAAKPMPAQTSPQFTNRLAKEKSPYLLQHQHNPVDWYPWGKEAFEKARRENKPIFLSIGYSTCHWCHVMEHESFEDEATAKILNEHYVAIKVDREERPDVDKVYMTYVQALTGGGGWPMSVWLTPELKPFLGGTYYPPVDRGGRPGFKTVLLRIAEGWKTDRAGIIEHGENTAKQLTEMVASAPTKVEVSAQTALAQGLSELTRRFDAEQGGFGDAPKFPQPSIINFLLRMAVRPGLGATPEEGAKDRAQALKMALFTLGKMAGGGMHDQLGGGFHRYSVDTFWHIPHFEKMLYDQAQLARSYTDAFQLTKDPRWEKTARDVFDYILREMTDQAGGFHSAEDADSLAAAGTSEKTEGAFYVWTKAEIDQALGEDAALFDRFYGVEAEGNAPKGSDPMGEFKGKNTLIQRLTMAEAAALFKKPEPEITASLAKSRRALFELRARRPRPHLDDKVITAWNGLMIGALARGAQVFDDPRYLAAAQRSAKFIRSKLWKDGALLRSYRLEPGQVAGFADDYAMLIAGLLDLYEADFDTAWLAWALELQAKMDALFYDPEHGGYFQTVAGQSDVLFRTKEDYDGAEPTPGSVAVGNLLRLAQITDSKEFQARAEKTVQSHGEQLQRLPSGMAQMLCALDYSLAKPRQIVIAGASGAPETKALLHEVRAVFAPNQLLLLADGGAGQEWLGKKLETVASMGPVKGAAAAYVCENYVCQAPETDPAKLRVLLSKAGK